jgi:carbonic anhydrase/acetyltransferase-like protein (isoleucine patch superfamily)
MIGMNAVIMDDVVVGEESIVGALSFVSANTVIPKRSLVVGNPAKIIKEVSEEMIAWKTKGTQLYQQLPADCFESLIACTALSEIPENRPAQESLYQTWEDLKAK